MTGGRGWSRSTYGQGVAELISDVLCIFLVYSSGLSLDFIENMPTTLTQSLPLQDIIQQIPAFYKF